MLRSAIPASHHESALWPISECHGIDRTKSFETEHLVSSTRSEVRVIGVAVESDIVAGLLAGELEAT
jgi:hypothetical protein